MEGCYEMRGLPARVDFVIVAQHVPWALVTRLCLIHMTMLGVLGFLLQLEPKNTLDLHQGRQLTFFICLANSQFYNLHIKFKIIKIDSKFSNKPAEPNIEQHQYFGKIVSGFPVVSIAFWVSRNWETWKPTTLSQCLI